jgi:hypothetical protein
MQLHLQSNQQCHQEFNLQSPPFPHPESHQASLLPLYPPHIYRSRR